MVELRSKARGRTATWGAGAPAWVWPDSLGGFVRHHELPRIVASAAPVYAKFGLRNAPDVYPSGTHLDQVTVALSKERVRRARLGLDMLERAGSDCHFSKPGAAGLALPVRS